MNDQIARVLERKGYEVQIATPDTIVSHAVAHMNSYRIGALVVLASGRLSGIFTERDVLVRVVARGLDPCTTKVAEVMTGEPIVIRSDETVAEAMRIITVHRCRHLPVVDDRGELCGLISSGDLTSWIVQVQQRTIHDLHDYIRAA